MAIFQQLAIINNSRACPSAHFKANRWHHIDMPKANLRVLEFRAGLFYRAECSVCGEKFYVPPGEKDFKEDMSKQFDAHLFSHHRRQWDARQKKIQRST